MYVKLLNKGFINYMFRKGHLKIKNTLTNPFIVEQYVRITYAQILYEYITKTESLIMPSIKRYA